VVVALGLIAIALGLLVLIAVASLSGEDLGRLIPGRVLVRHGAVPEASHFGSFRYVERQTEGIGSDQSGAAVGGGDAPAVGLADGNGRPSACPLTPDSRAAA
jgi:hypothetical protein